MIGKAISHPLPIGTVIMTIDRRLYRTCVPAKTSEGDGYVCFPGSPDDRGVGTFAFVWAATIVEAFASEVGP